MRERYRKSHRLLYPTINYNEFKYFDGLQASTSDLSHGNDGWKVRAAQPIERAAR